MRISEEYSKHNINHIFLYLGTANLRSQFRIELYVQVITHQDEQIYKLSSTSMKSFFFCVYGPYC